jgi:hypothetical protein
MGQLPTVDGGLGVWATTRTGGGNCDWQITLASDTTRRNCHLVIATDGAFFWSANKVGTQRIYIGCACLPYEQADVTDSAPWCFFRGGPATPDVSPTWPSSTYPAGLSAYSAAHFVHASSQATAGYGIVGMNPQGTAQHQLMPAIPTTNHYNTSGTYQTSVTNWGKDSRRQTWPEFPVWVVSYGSGSASWRGYPRDLWLAYPHPEGTVDPSGASAPNVKRMLLGDFWIPSPPSVSPITW